MAGDTGFADPVDRIVVAGKPPIVTEKEVETATNVYPGRLVMLGSTDHEVVVHTGATQAPFGWMGYEQTSGQGRPATVDTVYTANKFGAVLRGGGFVIQGSLAAGTYATIGDTLFSWAAGQLVPGMMIDGVPAIKIPFTKSTSEADTGLDIPSGVIVKDVFIYCTTNASGATIDVGILSSEGGGDADGFLDGESLATAGWVVHNLVDATAANITVGVLLDEVQIKDATGTPVYLPIFLSPGMVGDGTATSISYTTSDHTVVGNMFVLLVGAGIVPVAIAEETVDATSAAANIHARSVI